MSKKLQNVKAVQQMLDGTHKFQTKKTVGFSDATSVAKKNDWMYRDANRNRSKFYSQVTNAIEKLTIPRQLTISKRRLEEDSKLSIKKQFLGNILKIN